MSVYGDMYRDAAQQGTGAFWKRVAVIRAGVAEGANIEALLAECGKESGDSPEQVLKFYAVAKVLKEDDIRWDFDYWTHQAACVVDPRINPDDPTTYHYALHWLDVANDNPHTRTSKTGKVSVVHKKHTGRTLASAIRAAAGNGKPAKATVVFKGEARIYGLHVSNFGRGAELTFILPETDPDDFKMYETVTVTITRTPQSAAREQEAAAPLAIAS